MTVRYLFDGGYYKRGIDNGRDRVPLTPSEAAMVFYDPEVPGDTDNSIGTEFNMAKWASHLCNLAVGDELLIGLAPDAAWYRGLWMASYDAVPGLEVTLDLVSVNDIYDAWLADGDPSGVTGFYTAASGSIDYDFADGLGQATKDACYLAELHGGTESDYRNEDALVMSPFASTRPATLGQSLYFRLTVTAVAGENTETGCCSDCGNVNQPTFVVGALYDRTCFDKQRVRKFCNCPSSGCGCDEGDCDS